MLSTKEFLRQIQQGGQYFPMTCLDHAKTVKEKVGAIQLPNGKLIVGFRYEIAGPERVPVIKITELDLV